jgi:hypothetical protein
MHPFVTKRSHNYDHGTIIQSLEEILQFSIAESPFARGVGFCALGRGFPRICARIALFLLVKERRHNILLYSVEEFQYGLCILAPHQYSLVAGSGSITTLSSISFVTSLGRSNSIPTLRSESLAVDLGNAGGRNPS